MFGENVPLLPKETSQLLCDDVIGVIICFLPMKEAIRIRETSKKINQDVIEYKLTPMINELRGVLPKNFARREKITMREYQCIIKQIIKHWEKVKPKLISGYGERFSGISTLIEKLKYYPGELLREKNLVSWEKKEKLAKSMGKKFDLLCRYYVPGFFSVIGLVLMLAGTLIALISKETAIGVVLLVLGFIVICGSIGLSVISCFCATCFGLCSPRTEVKKLVYSETFSPEIKKLQQETKQEISRLIFNIFKNI